MSPVTSIRCALLVLSLAGSALAVDGSPKFAPVPRFALPQSGLALVQAVQPTKPFTVAGEFGAILGEQSGVFEAWQFPVKILSHVHLTVTLANYPIPIDLADYAATIAVNPAYTTLTYSHAAFTIRQHMFVPRGGNAAAGPVVLFEIEAVRPLTLTLQFTPDVLQMWPAASYGRPSAEWVAVGESGYYLLHTDNEHLTAAVAMPRAKPGILAPYQERPKTWPVELLLAYDPQKDRDLFFPLLASVGPDSKALAGQLADVNRRVPELFAQTRAHYERLLASAVSVETPDAELNRALRWAEVAIDQCQVRFHDETGMIAGYYSSADSARPGFGWFFGRDTLWTSYAINSYGDFELTRKALTFLIKRQREDGKIMHEFAQTADLVDWKSLPYWYAAADSTPLFLMAMEDYVNASGDRAFLDEQWSAVEKAYRFMRAHDSDGDGIYENTEGTGWVESWPPGMPHQEVYLAALSQQGIAALSRLAKLTNHGDVAAEADRLARSMAATIPREYYVRDRQFYAFSRNANGTLDTNATIYPAVAWWDGHYALPDSATMLGRWSSEEFATDWGTRDVSEQSPLYDPISYHQGSVWPLFTGWVALAQYRARHPLAGFTLLQQNAGLTYGQDLGAVTELLSGAYYQELGRSSSHQLWSSAMVISPLMRGLLGLDVDALHQRISVDPQLPADWDHAAIRRIAVGAAHADLEFSTEGRALVLRARADRPLEVCLAHRCGTASESPLELRGALPAVDLAIPHGLPLPGAATRQLKVTGEERDGRVYQVTFRGQSGAEYRIPVRTRVSGVTVSGGRMQDGYLLLAFPASGARYQEKTIRFAW